MAEIEKQYKAAIYCGHGLSTDGSFDPGCVYGSITEAASALPITKSFVKYSRYSGIKVWTDVDEGENNNMNAVKQIREANANDVDVFISLHIDWLKAPSGTMPLYCKGSKDGKRLAECLNMYVEEMTGIGTRGVTARTDLGELNQTNMEACIYELGSIKADRKEWDTEKECDEYGKALAMGLCYYFGIPFKDSDSTKKTSSSTKSTATSTKKTTTEKKLTVKQYQKNLKYYYGYYTGAVDGKKGEKTTEAIKAFQKAKGLTVDGVYGDKTDAKLKAVVKSLQKKLGVTEDGKIGDKTIEAIKAVQKKYGLTVDGIAGKNTFAALNGQLKVPTKTTTKAEKKEEAKEEKKEKMYSEHFARSEFKCKCGGKYCDGYPVEMNKKLINILEELREYYGGKPVSIRSGIRCKKHNANVGGVSNSTHRNGKAADIYISGICDSAAGRNKVVKKAYALGAKYAYCNTPGMGTSVHINV